MLSQYSINVTQRTYRRQIVINPFHYGSTHECFATAKAPTRHTSFDNDSIFECDLMRSCKHLFSDIGHTPFFLKSSHSASILPAISGGRLVNLITGGLAIGLLIGLP